MARNLITLSAAAAVLAFTPATVAAHSTIVGPVSQSNSQIANTTQIAHGSGKISQSSSNVFTNTQTGGSSSRSTSCSTVNVNGVSVTKCTSTP